MTNFPENKEKKRLKRTVSFFTLNDGTPVEMVYDAEVKMTQFVQLDENGTPVYHQEVLRDPREGILVPYSAQHPILQSGFVLFPGEAVEYGTEAELVGEIQVFIHRYVDLSPFFERIAAYYVLFTWVYDNFNELPYLRVVGDLGSGKTRFLLTMGGVCYKSILTMGATTVSPIFRVIDEYRGTMILDEADFNRSEEWADIVKILNSGHAKGMPVIRSEGKKTGSFEPRAFVVYSPKIIATRSYFKDKALESRFIVEDMGQRRLREDIPISLPDSFWAEALIIRNKLLMFRLRHFGKKSIKPELVDRGLEPRLNQIIVPLASIIDDQALIEDLKRSVQDYFRQTIADRGMSYEGQILEVVLECYKQGNDEPSIGNIRSLFIERFAGDYDERKVTARGLGFRIRSAFKVRTERRRDGYVIPRAERPKLERAFERYGILPQESEELVKITVEEVERVLGETSQVHDVHSSGRADGEHSVGREGGAGQEVTGF